MSAQTRIIVGVAAIIAVMAGFWFAVLAPKRAEIATVDGQVAQAETRRDAAVAAAALAEQAKSRYLRDYATVARLGKAVPADDDMASLVYQLETIARANDIDFRAVKLTATAAPAAPAPAAEPPPGAAAEGEDKDTDKDGDAEAAPTAPAAPVVAQPTPGTQVGPAGLLTVPFTFSFEGDYLKLQRLLKSINGLADNAKERITVQGRLLTVDGFALAAGPDGFPKLKATVSATAYVVPEADTTVTAGATPQGPAGAGPGAATTTAMTTQNAQGAGR